ncbi:adenylate/guanylate cyclase domain-containing protein [Nesterenkonia halotolerans]|uniref:Class 3 adenylate cyclase n=1 Tax=Nesterenkonia halotolerans TaxID=225325 RepID=A0ABR9J340_9MICC|nr:adenylate/guanylate cyclase domain-containing protein [Nesterenkonia halotolerans]MBE1513420.1 class 3 adenylate cyclase [Nesterenkonia halotolerans]
MSFETDLEEKIKTILNEGWKTSQGKSVPRTNDIALKNGSVEMEAAFLYADLADSTALQKNYNAKFAAKAIRTYLAGASTIIRKFDGDIKSFDGDRVMGVFGGESKGENAVKAAYMINWLVKKVINPLVKERHENNGTKTVWTAQHGIGIDVGSTFVARAGVRNASGETTHNDLIFTGRAPNVAAKLSALRGTQAGPIVITKDVFDLLNQGQKKKLKSDSPVWSSPTVEKVGPYSLTLYRTNYWRKT